MTGIDKLIHFGVCMAIAFTAALLVGMAGSNALGAVAGGVLTAMGAGAGKECGDMMSPTNRWDWWDIAADLCGTVAGATIWWLIFV